MKLGLSEIILILIIVGIILLVFRGMPSPRNATPPPARLRRLTAAEIEESRIKNSRRSRLRTLGGAFVVIGLLILASTLKMLDLILSWYVGASLIIIAGVAVLFLSSRL